MDGFAVPPGDYLVRVSLSVSGDAPGGLPAAEGGLLATRPVRINA